ncbi:hypothetical protein [Lentibacillus salicampi]|uniref:hypothetical protein n=1 Tax=Lentibacillus salicampi TaxID=175306 RepID=UPI001ADDCD0C|nr:hypothetical protein [Lentibacillus salicampi]
MTMLVDYIIALTNLYGLVAKEKVVEIYNMQNDGNVGAADVDDEVNNYADELTKNFVEFHGDYFVNQAIMEFEEFEQELAKRQGKPFYIPNQKELLRYKDDFYFERTKVKEHNAGACHLPDFVELYYMYGLWFNTAALSLY